MGLSAEDAVWKRQSFCFHGPLSREKILRAALYSMQAIGEVR